MSETRSWREMYAKIADLLIRRTGTDIATWNGPAALRRGLIDEAGLRGWLAEQGVTGYPQQLLVMEQ